MATARPNYYCHKCQRHIGHITNDECPICKDNFIEEVNPSELMTNGSETTSNSRRSAEGGNFFHRTFPMGNTTIFVSGAGPGASNHQTFETNRPENIDFGTFLQTIMGQLAGGLMGATAAPPQTFPILFQNPTGGTFVNAADIDTFLTQFLNQMGENSGPAPAPENRINAIPTVTITAEQARDNLQCAICMEDFKENETAKRLPCSHHFHEECILRWLRLHGTCPTCRVTLDGENSTRRDYSSYSSNRNSSTRNNQRRHDDDNPGSHSNLMDFD